MDVGNNVGKTNEAYSPFPTRPFAIGIVTDVAAGDPVPAGATVRFDVNVADPDVRGYLQESLRSGRLWLTVTWLGESSGLSGTPTYPDFATRDNLVYDPPRLTVEGVLIGPDDDDEDGLPDDWERLFLGGRDFSGDDDPDGDGVTNITEWLQGTDPGSEHSVLRIQPLRAVADSGAGFAITDDGPGAPRVEVSTDLKEWREATGRLEFLEPRNGHWIPNSESAEAVQFFRLRRSDPDPESPRTLKLRQIMNPHSLLRTLLAAAALALGSPAIVRAHSVWIEPDSTGALVVRFAEPDGKLERSPGHLDSLLLPNAWSAAGGSVLTNLLVVKKADHFALTPGIRSHQPWRKRPSSSWALRDPTPGDRCFTPVGIRCTHRVPAP